MLQKARSSNSKSFLRELEDALVLIKDEKDKNYFLQKMQEVFRKRRDPALTLTGEKALKSELLAYLKERGYVQTANVWARNVPMNQKELDELLDEFERIKNECKALFKELENKRIKLDKQRQSIQEGLEEYRMNLRHKNFHYKSLRRR